VLADDRHDARPPVILPATFEPPQCPMAFSSSPHHSSRAVAGKKPDVCPDQGVALRSLAAIDPAGEAMQSLIHHLIDRRVALTSTLPVLETFTPGRPAPPGLDVLDPILRQQFLQIKAGIDRDTTSIFTTLYPKLAKLDVAFFRAGGVLLAGTDPTGVGGVIAGYADQRELELLVEAGLTPLEAIEVCTLNGATFLGRLVPRSSNVAGSGTDCWSWRYFHCRGLQSMHPTHSPRTGTPRRRAGRSPRTLRVWCLCRDQKTH
jgi:hypothetical protein